MTRDRHSPRLLGIDGDREVLTFIDGDVATDPRWQPGHSHRLPPYARIELALRGEAILIRKLHAAASGFRPVITSYRFHPHPPKAGEIVSHGDLGPWNTVYRHGIPVAFIDRDTAQPVDPLADLAAAAWAFVPLAPPGQLSEAGFDPLPKWLLGLPCGNDRRNYVITLSQQAMGAVGMLLHGSPGTRPQMPPPVDAQQKAEAAARDSAALPS